MAKHVHAYALQGDAEGCRPQGSFELGEVMALPNGRKIVVDGKSYEWICKNKRSPNDFIDDYGNEEPAYKNIVTIRADEDGGKLVQHRIDRSSITPEFIANLIRADVIQGQL